MRRTAGGVALVLLTISAVSAAVVAVRHADEVGQRTAASHSTRAAAPKVAVISDGSYLQRGASEDRQWTALIGRDLGADVVVRADSSHGYLADGTDSFTALAGGIPPDTRVVVFAGGVGRRSSAVKLAAAATGAYAAAKSAVPSVRVVVVPRPTSTAPDDATNTVLRSAAALAGARWVDASGWFPSAGATRDGGLTAAGVREAAHGLEPRLRPLLVD